MTIVDDVNASKPCEPATVPLPSIGGAPASKEASAKLRMLAQTMRWAGLGCDMPPDISEYSWGSLSSLVDIQLDHRRLLADENFKIIHDEYQMRISLGR